VDRPLVQTMPLRVLSGGCTFVASIEAVRAFNGSGVCGGTRGNS
jgi:hypothetical protein